MAGRSHSCCMVLRSTRHIMADRFPCCAKQSRRDTVERQSETKIHRGAWMTTAWRGTRPGDGEFNPYYSKYIDRVPEGDVVDTLTRQIAGTTDFLRGLPADKHDHRYAPGKWSIKEVIGHICD